MPHIFRSLISGRRLRASATVLVTSLALAAGVLLPATSVVADTIDSFVIINVTSTSGAVPSSVLFTSSQHGFGNCVAAAGSFYVSGGSRTCTGEQFGPPTSSNPADGLYLTTTAPSGYKFNGFTTTGYPSSGSVGCSSYCYMNFSSGGTTVWASFSPLPPAIPAAPSASQVSVTSRTASSIALSWTGSIAPGGVNRYEVIKNGTVLATTTNRTFTQTGLACNTGHSYSVRVVDNYGQSAFSNTITTTTTACPVPVATPANPAPTATKSTSTTPAKTNSTATTPKPTTPAVAGANTTTPTGTSSTSTTTTPSNNNTDSLGVSTGADEATTTDTTTTKKKGIPAGIKILIGLVGIALITVIVRFILKRRGGSGNDYWTQPPQY